VNDVPRSWNRLVARFADDLDRPAHAAAAAALAALAAGFAQCGVPLRSDHERTWEHAHVLVGVDRLLQARGADRPLPTLLDLGGGNSALAYVLAERGLPVTVLDVDQAVVAAVRRAAVVAGCVDRLHADVVACGRLPIVDAAVDVVVCVSVIEGVLRCDRPRFWAEVRRVLRPGGTVLLTFDYGPGARAVGDPPVDRGALARDLVVASGLELRGELPAEPVFGPDGPPVRQVVPTVDGLGTRTVAYTFGALELRRPRGD
jgi:SAM-dependent methyltransferase